MIGGHTAVGANNAADAIIQEGLAYERLNAANAAAAERQGQKEQAKIAEDKLIDEENKQIDRQRRDYADYKAKEIFESSPPKFKKGDIVKLKMTGDTRKTFDFSPAKLSYDNTKVDPRLGWVVKSWDGAIGIVSSDDIVFNHPLNPNKDEYKYKVKVQRVSGGSAYNPKPPADKNMTLPVEENILERDMESITLTKEQKDADVTEFKKTWRVEPIPIEESIEKSGGKRRSKSSNKPKKSAKRVKTAKRAKSRKIRRRHK